MKLLQTIAWQILVLIGAMNVSCRSLDKVAPEADGLGGGGSSLSGVQDQSGSYVMTSWFRASEPALLSKLRFPINANQAGNLGGASNQNSQTTVDVRLVPTFVPNVDQAQLRLNLFVSLVGTGGASERGVTVTGGVVGNALVTKDLSLRLDGMTVQPSQLQMNVDPMNPNIVSTGLLRRLKSRIANQRYWSQIGASVQVAQSELSKVPSKLDQEIDKNITLINRTWKESFFDPFISTDTSGARTRFFTTDDSINFAVFQLQSKLPAPIKPIIDDQWENAAAVLLLHQSQVDYQLNHLLQGKELSTKDLANSFCKFDVGFSLCSKPKENPDKQAKPKADLDINRRIRFISQERPIVVKFLKPGESGATLPGLEISVTAGFEPNIDKILKSTVRFEIDASKRLARRTKLTVEPFVSAVSQTNSKAPPGNMIALPFQSAWTSIEASVDSAYASVVERVFSSVLPESIDIFPVSVPLMGELTPRGWTINEGWLRVAWDFRPWQEISCASVDASRTYLGFSCNNPSNGADVCFEVRGLSFYGNERGWIRCGDSWKGKSCDEIKTVDQTYYGKRCRHTVNGVDSCWYFTGFEEAGNTNGWKPCPKTAL